MNDFEILGDVLIENRVVLKGVLFSISSSPGSDQGLGAWTGTFEVPEDDYAAEIAIYDARELTARFEDGTTRGFTIRTQPMGSERTAYIEGNGNIR